MMRLLIADDEPLVRYHLRSLIAEIDPSITVLEAANGEELIDLVRQDRADGALVDVRMPKKSGLSAIKELRQQGFEVSWGVLSSYSDFAYAREALTLGALGYVLKPPSLEETKDLLEKIQQREIQKKRERLTAFERLWEAHRVQEAGVLYVPIVFAVDGRVSPRRIQDLVSERLLRADDGPFLVALREGKRPLTLEGLAVVSEGSRYPEGLAKATGFWNGVYALLGSLETGLRVMGIVDEPRKAWETLEERMDELGSLLTYRPLFPALLLPVSKAETLLQRYGDTTRNAAQALTRLVEGLLGGDVKNVASLLIDAQASLLRLEKEESRIVLRYLESALGRSLLSPAEAEAPDFWPQGWKRIFDSPLWDRLAHPPTESPHPASTDQESVVRLIKAYLQRHGFEGITLAKTARDLGFTPNYLSFLFHQKTGTTFTEYITELRLQRARELLWSGKSVKETAWAVGYGSERHFARLYRHRFGLSPGLEKRNRRISAYSP